MHSQLYLTGRLVSDPEAGQTKKGALFVKLLMETQQIREVRPGEVQAEIVTLPIALYSRPAEQVRDLRKGDSLTIGAHIYGTEFKTPEGAINRGVRIVADVVFKTTEAK